MNGILLIDKPSGWTSNDVVQKLRGALHEKRIGHAGTLDPMATGLLTVFVGRATRAVEFAESDEKTYIAGLRLGIVTDTQDITGTILQTGSVSNITPELLEHALQAFRGTIRQIPPMYSAVRVNGQRLYDLARQGKTVERAPREIRIDELRILEGKDTDWTLFVRCSKGTYIRTLCHDMGEMLGTGAAMEHLLRTRVGQFDLATSIKLDDAEKIMKSQEPEKIASYILPVDSFFEDAPKAHVKEEGMRYLLNGNTLPRNLTDLPREMTAKNVRMYDQSGQFYALYRYDPAKDDLKNVKMFLPKNKNAARAGS